MFDTWSAAEMGVTVLALISITFASVNFSHVYGDYTVYRDRNKLPPPLHRARSKGRIAASRVREKAWKVFSIFAFLVHAVVQGFLPQRTIGSQAEIASIPFMLIFVVLILALIDSVLTFTSRKAIIEEQSLEQELDDLIEMQQTRRGEEQEAIGLRQDDRDIRQNDRDIVQDTRDTEDLLLRSGEQDEREVEQNDREVQQNLREKDI